MPLDTDAIVDRRRLRRKLTFWRVLAFLIVAAVIITTAVVLVDPARWIGGNQRIDRAVELFKGSSAATPSASSRSNVSAAPR